MKADNINAQMDGYAEIQQEIAVLEKYALDRGAERGQVSRIIDYLHPKTLNLRVSEIREETGSTKTFRMVSRDGHLPPFQAGQYVNLFVDVEGVRTSRPYSISSSPTQTAYYDITVRRVEDGFVSCHLLDGVHPGDTFQSTSPSGQFFHNPLFHGDDLVFIAGGSGITPFMSMIREMSDRGLGRRIQLIYGSRSSEDIIFRKKIEKRSRRHKNLTMHTVISEPAGDVSGLTGFITAELITKLVDNIHEKMVYVCGPEAMYTFVLAELARLNIPRRRIRVEVFGPPSDVTCQPGWPEGVYAADSFKVTLPGGRVVDASAGEPLMNSLERAGVTIEVSCRSGECSLCRTRLVAGKVFQPHGVKIRKSDRVYGYIHPCVAYPLEDLDIRI